MNIQGNVNQVLRQAAAVVGGAKMIKEQAEQKEIQKQKELISASANYAETSEKEQQALEAKSMAERDYNYASAGINPVTGRKKKGLDLEMYYNAMETAIGKYNAIKFQKDTYAELLKNLGGNE